MVGSDDKDSTSLPGLVKKDYWKGVKEICSSGTKPLTGIRLGIAKEHFSEGLSAEVHWALQEALKVYEGLGAKLVEISLPLTHLSIPAYYVIAAAEASSNLSRFDGVRYGYHSEDGKNLDSLYVQSRSEGFGEEVKRRILTGTFVLSHGYYDAYYNKALMVRQAIRSDFDLTFTQCDVVFAPTSPVTAWNLGEKVDDPVSMYLADIFTLGVNLAGLPALSHPAGFSDKSGTLLPIGAQLIAKSQDELRLLSLAACFQQETDWHLRCPPVC
jgi:aspartyl-tRNA(Asn)/glutamyl-tRNA(Gln) amidotransferase subunit A